MLLERTHEKIGPYPLARLTIKAGESHAVFERLGFQDPGFVASLFQDQRLAALGVTSDLITQAFGYSPPNLPPDYFMEVVIQ